MATPPTHAAIAALTAGLLLSAPSAAADGQEAPAAAPEPGAAATIAEPEDAAPTEAEATPGPEMMRYPPSSARFGLIAGGVGILGLAYGLTALCATTWPEVPGSDAMLVPVVGPWGALAQSGCSSDDPDCGALLVLRTMLLVLDGLAQAGGAGLIGEGVFMTTEAAAPDSASWMVLPAVAPGQMGLGVVGTF